MPRWVLTCVASETYIEKSINTIHQARTRGKWVDDIVLLIPDTLSLKEEYMQIFNTLSVIIKPVINRSADKIISFWKQHPTHEKYEYLVNRPGLYIKYYVFDVFFRQWDIVFYLDVGGHIFNSLDRIKDVCEPKGWLYAHSDSYPTYEWNLSIQFAFDLVDKDKEKKMKKKYNLECNYFQSGLLIFNSSLIEENTVTDLLNMNEEYPFVRGDQGIMNLYFTLERNLWKPLPIQDKYGFFYDFWERNGHKACEYIYLKYPRFD